MDERRVDPLSDEALERALSEALEVDPSPEFLPRVRARVAELPAPGTWSAWPTWTWATAAAVFTVVVVGWSVAGRAPWSVRPSSVESSAGGKDVTAPLTVHSQPSTESSVAVVAEAPTAPVATRSSRPSRRVRNTVGGDEGGARGAARLLDVQVSPDEALALRQLVEAVRAERVGSAAFPALGGAVAPLEPIGTLVVSDLVVDPIRSPLGEGGEGL